ncbi:hypothetical protein [Butyrivibrio sp.]|uniref:hypothetical protein n=1 Tax=Butyrivibrio sp. TaxID=28121 RepID=UPI0025C61C32|nr:hypothetical protein [Butyrivibrio sp.]MBE5838089.1 hypothetical protein [Butyrivibrio sp.]
MSSERDLTKDMLDELKRNGIVASYKDFEARTQRLISLHDGFGEMLDFIPDFIMIDLLKEFKCELLGQTYSNMDELADGILNYKHSSVQLMRKIARHFLCSILIQRNLSWIKTLRDLARHSWIKCRSGVSRNYWMRI